MINREIYYKSGGFDENGIPHGIHRVYNKKCEFISWDIVAEPNQSDEHYCDMGIGGWYDIVDSPRYSGLEMERGCTDPTASNYQDSHDPTPKDHK